MIRTFLLSLSLLLCGSLAVHGQPAAPAETSDTSSMPCMQKAEKLLDEALVFIQKYYYRKNQTDWTDLTSRAHQQLHAAGNCDDAYASIDWCFQQLNEHHSFVMP